MMIEDCSTICHRARLVGAVALLAASATLAFSLHASAYYVEARGDENNPVRYADLNEDTPALELEYRVNVASLPDAAADAAIDMAFASWSSVECSNLSFVRGADTDSVAFSHWQSDAESERYILVLFYAGSDLWGSNAPIGNFFFAHDGSGTLIGGTVVLNSRDYMWSTDPDTSMLDIQGTMTALVGRSLGITSAIEGNSTRPAYSPGDTSKRMLGGDDQASLRFLYPQVDCAMPPPPPEDMCMEVELPGDPCPPLPETTQPDAMVTPIDAGPSLYDAGARGDGGGSMNNPGDGCSCRASGGSSPPSPLLLSLLLGLVVLRRRRR